LQTGDRIRLSLKTGPVEGTFQSWTPQQVTAGTVTARREDVLKIERYRQGGWGRGKTAAVGAAIGLGVGFVVITYFLASTAYMMVLPLHGDPHGATVFARGIQYAAEDRIGAAVLQQIFPHIGGYLMAAAILISTFGCANGMTLAGARVYYAMAQDKLFFQSVGKLHPKWKTPVAGLIVQAIWTIFLCVSGSYGQLLDYIIFAALVFYALTIVGLFVLRVKQPDAPRPYKAIGYPFIPALYIVMAGSICAVLLRYKPQYTWPGLILVLLGIPVYLYWSRGARQTAS